MPRATSRPLVAGALFAALFAACAPAAVPASGSDIVKLPSAHPLSTMTLDEALASRRSVRDLAPETLSTEIVGRLLWAAQGVTSPEGYRTAPSAGALYPLELYVATPSGAFHYLPDTHELVPVRDRDLRADLRAAALDQEPVGDAGVVIVIAADPSRTAAKYGVDRGERYVLLEAGHAAQNVLLEAVALGLGAVPIGAFDDAAIARVVGLPSSQVPLYLIAVGNRR